MYGKANIDGELPGDPNADLTTNKFNPWIFHGGLFTGHMDYNTAKDQSGTARVQFQLVTPGDATTYLSACLTCFASGIRGTSGGNSVSPGTIGLFRPASNDPNLSYGQQANWTNSWALSPGGTQSGPGDFTKAPYYTVTPNTTNNGTQTGDQFNFLNWQMPNVSEVWQTAYGGDGNSSDNQMWTSFALCQTDETAYTWQYFGSSWIEQVPSQVAPLSDSRPRIWKVRYP